MMSLKKLKSYSCFSNHRQLRLLNENLSTMPFALNLALSFHVRQIVPALGEADEMIRHKDSIKSAKLKKMRY